MFSPCLYAALKNINYFKNPQNPSLLDQYISSSVVDFKKSKIRGYNPKTYYLTIDLPFMQDKFNETSYMIFETDSDTVQLVDIFLNLDMPFHQVSSHPSINHCPDCF